VARPAPDSADGAGDGAPTRRSLKARRSLRILHVNDLPLDEGGGAEIHIGRLVDAQRSAGDDPRVLAGAVRHTGAGRVLDLWDRGAQRLVERTIAQLQPDVVHLHNVVRELSPSVLRAVRETPAVLTVHDLRTLGAGEHHLPDPRAAADRLVIGPLVRRLAHRHVDMLLAVSETVARQVRAAGLRRVVAVPVPVPAPAAVTAPPGTCFDVLAAAKLAPDKGIDVLIGAFARVAAAHPDARLVVAGDGPARQALERQAAPLGSRAVFTGRLDAAAMSAAMARARVVVVPSLPALRPEGASLTAAEAARHGRPVVTSDDPAAAEVGRSVGGTVVPAGDVAALASVLDRLLSDPRQADRLGVRAAELAARYDVTAVAALVRSIYADVMR
jgi:glycosyltransferase involved in cell wall biosynthesis